MRKTVSKDTRLKYNDQKFKKAYQVVDRPKVMDHNINDEYFRHPPQVPGRPYPCCPTLMTVFFLLLELQGW